MDIMDKRPKYISYGALLAFLGMLTPLMQWAHLHHLDNSQSGYCHEQHESEDSHQHESTRCDTCLSLDTLVIYGFYLENVLVDCSAVRESRYPFSRSYLPVRSISTINTRGSPV